VIGPGRPTCNLVDQEIAAPGRDADTLSDSTREPVLNPNVAAVNPAKVL